MGNTVDGEWTVIIPPWYDNGFAYQDMKPSGYLPIAELAGGSYAGAYGGSY